METEPGLNGYQLNLKLVTYNTICVVLKSASFLPTCDHVVHVTAFGTLLSMEKHTASPGVMGR